MLKRLIKTNETNETFLRYKRVVNGNEKMTYI